MAFMNWDEKYAVKNLEMDNQHKKLIVLVNQLHDAMKPGKGKEEIGNVLKSLAEYTVSHFTAEEKMMRSIQFDNFDAHKVEHTKLLEQVTGLINRFENGETLPVMEVMNFLKKWLVDHIMKEDMKYSTVAQPA